MQSRNILIGLGILVLVAAGAFVFSQSQYGNPAPVVAPRTAPETVPVEEASKEGVREITVSGDEYSFSPNSLALTAGEQVKVTFKNTGNLPHNFVITELGVSTKTIPGGQEDSVTFTVDKSGTYAFFCSVGDHRQRGMEGELRAD